MSKAPITTFNITCRVPADDWEKTKALGFKESDIPEMLAGMINDLADQAPGRG